MPDVFCRKKRSQVMARIQSSGNKATELRLIVILRASGLKGWRRHSPLFGKPDFVFPNSKLAVFVDGCFWHGCPKCYHAPKSNAPYWASKIKRNRGRDLKVNRELRRRGWSVMRFWECELTEKAISVIGRLRKALNARPGAEGK